MNNKIQMLKNKMVKHSPEICISVGVVGVIGSTVMACKATTKIGDIFDERNAGLQQIEDGLNDESLKDKYSVEDAQKDRLLINAQTGLKLVKLYGPSIVVGTISLGLIINSNRILSNRNAAISAAYLSLDKGIKEYRSRVIERFGEQVDKELRYGFENKKIKRVVTDPNTGKEKTEDQNTNILKDSNLSDYSIIFDKDCGAWQNDDTYNEYILRAEQNYANDVLKVRGHMFLNDVYDRLGIERTKAGQIVGWVYNPDNQVGDNYIDFRAQEIAVENEDKTGYEYKTLLDFNVDGNVLDLI